MHVYAMRPQRSPSRRQAKLTQCVTTRGARNAGASRAVRRAWGGSRANQRLHMREARFVEQMPRASIFRVRVARRKICCRSRTRRGEPVGPMRCASELAPTPPLGGNCAVLQHQAHDLADGSQHRKTQVQVQVASQHPTPSSSTPDCSLFPRLSFSSSARFAPRPDSCRATSTEKESAYQFSACLQEVWLAQQFSLSSTSYKNIQPRQRPLPVRPAAALPLQ